MQGDVAMSIADMIYEQVKSLPDPLIREVLDFVTALKERQDRSDFRNLMDAQTAGLRAVWDNPADEIWNDA